MGGTAALSLANRVLPWDATETLLLDDKTRRDMQEMCDRLVTRDAPPPALRQDLHAAVHHVIKQKTLAADLGAARLTAVRNAPTVEEQAYLQSAGGTGAGAFLDGPVTAETMMHDNLWQATVRHRPGMKMVACDNFPTQPCGCHHRTAQGHRCAAPLDAEDTHAIHCATGGGTLARHSVLARCVGGLAAEVLRVRPQYEQRVQHLDRYTVRGQEQQAIMDVSYVL